MGSNIFWDEVRVKYLGMSYPNDLSDLRLTSAIKISSRLGSSYKKQIDLDKIVERARPIHAYDLKLLTPEDTISIYTAHADENGTTIVKDETEANIHTFNFYTKNHEKSQLAFDIVNTLKYEYGANARTAFRSLYDLNDSFVVFHISANDGKKFNPGAVYLELKSSLGFDVIPIQINTQMLKQFDGRMILFGVYIPKDYWTLE
ncbi:hypothetical protein ACI5C3_001885 [Vibrio vulnificus]